MLLLLLRIYCRCCGDHSGTGNINPLLVLIVVVFCFLLAEHFPPFPFSLVSRALSLYFFYFFFRG